MASNQASVLSSIAHDATTSPVAIVTPTTVERVRRQLRSAPRRTARQRVGKRRIGGRRRSARLARPRPGGATVRPASAGTTRAAVRAGASAARTALLTPTTSPRVIVPGWNSTWAFGMLRMSA
ncbi:hypothetical protein D3C83_44050 [compost metagenome]